MPRLTKILALLLFGLFTGVTLLWLSLDRSPPNWDDAWYLANSLDVYDALTQRGVLGFLSSMNSVLGFKAPLIAALPTPFYLLLGRHWHAAYLVNIVAMFILFAALHRIATRLWSARAAVLAIAITGTMPLLYGLARWYMVDYSLAALVAVAVALLLERDRQALFVGIVCGLGLLLKAAFALFLLPAFVYAWSKSRRRLQPVWHFAAPCFVLALPWYAGHWQATLINALSAGYGLSATVQGTGPIFSPHALTTYLARLAVGGVSPYYVALGSGLLACAFLLRRPRPQIPRLVWLWMLPFVVFLFGGNKDLRYVAPVLPAFALLLSASLDCALPRTMVGHAVAAVLLVYPVVQMFAVSFAVPYRTDSIVYARPFDRTVWPLDQIVRSVAAHAAQASEGRPLLLVGADRGSLNSNNLELTAVALQLPLRLETTAHARDMPALLARLDHAEFFLYEDGGEPESPVFNPYIAQLVRRVRSDPQFVELPFAPLLPDGGVVRVFQRV